MLPSNAFSLVHDGIPWVLLRRVLPHAEFHGCRDLVVTTMTTDSHRVHPGGLFVSLSGGIDGDEAMTIAVQRGAAAIVCERRSEQGGRVQVVVSDVRAAVGRIAHALAGDPSRCMPIIGMNGAIPAASDNLRAIFGAAGLALGVAERRMPGASGADCIRDAREVADVASGLIDAGTHLGILEFSAAELAARAADGFEADSALIFTPRPCDAGTRRGELAAIARLTRSVRRGGLIAVQADDPIGDLLMASNPLARAVTFGLDGAGDVSATIDDSSREGARIRITGLDREVTIRRGTTGVATLLSALGAAAIARGYGLSDEVIVAGLEAASPSNVGFDPASANWDVPATARTPRNVRAIRKSA